MKLENLISNDIAEIRNEEARASLHHYIARTANLWNRSSEIKELYEACSSE